MGYPTLNLESNQSIMDAPIDWSKDGNENEYKEEIKPFENHVFNIRT